MPKNESDSISEFFKFLGAATRELGATFSFNVGMAVTWLGLFVASDGGPLLLLLLIIPGIIGGVLFHGFIGLVQEVWTERSAGRNKTSERDTKKTGEGK